MNELAQKFSDVNRCLIEAGADIESRAFGKYTALHMAGERGDAGFAGFLVEANADINSCSTDLMFTPLSLAAKAGHTDVVRVRAIRLAYATILGLKHVL